MLLAQHGERCPASFLVNQLRKFGRLYFACLFGLKFALVSVEAIVNDLGAVLIRGLAMSIEHPPHKDRLGALLLRRRNDELYAALIPLLEEVAALPDDETHRQEIHNILTLRKENTELRALAVKLSNLLGDLPAHEWEDAVAAHA